MRALSISGLIVAGTSLILFGGCGGSSLSGDPSMRPSSSPIAASSPTVVTASSLSPDSGAIEGRYAVLTEGLQKSDLASVEDVFSRSYRFHGLTYPDVIQGISQLFADHRGTSSHLSAVFQIREIDIQGDQATVSGETDLVPEVIRPSFSLRSLFPSNGTPACWRKESDGVWRLVGETGP